MVAVIRLRAYFEANDSAALFAIGMKHRTLTTFEWPAGSQRFAFCCCCAFRSINPAVGWVGMVKDGVLLWFDTTYFAMQVAKRTVRRATSRNATCARTRDLLAWYDCETSGCRWKQLRAARWLVRSSFSYIRPLYWFSEAAPATAKNYHVATTERT